MKTIFLRRMKSKPYEKVAEHLTADVEGFSLLVLVSLEQTQSTLNYTCYCVRSYDLKYHMIDNETVEFKNAHPFKIYSHVSLHLKKFTLKYDRRQCDFIFKRQFVIVGSLLLVLRSKIMSECR